jgi:hypothetical protein
MKNRFIPELNENNLIKKLNQLRSNIFLLKGLKSELFKIKLTNLKAYLVNIYHISSSKIDKLDIFQIKYKIIGLIKVFELIKI